MATKGTRSTKNPNGDAKQQWGGDESGGHFLNAEARRTRRSAEEVLLDGVRGTGTGCAIGHMDTASGLRRNRCQSLWRNMRGLPTARHMALARRKCPSPRRWLYPEFRYFVENTGGRWPQKAQEAQRIRMVMRYSSGGGDESGGHFLNAEARGTRRSAE